jgi:hypothetical protein
LRLFSRFVVSGCYNNNTSDGCTFSSETLSTSFSGFCRILVHNLPQNGCCKLPIVLIAFCKPVPVQFSRCMRQELALRFGSKMATNPWPPTVAGQSQVKGDRQEHRDPLTWRHFWWRRRPWQLQRQKLAQRWSFVGWKYRPRLIRAWRRSLEDVHSSFGNLFPHF